MSRRTIATLFLVATALVGCGKLGTLDQPAPLYGAQTKADYDAKQRAAADARARAKVAAEQDNPVQDSADNPPLAHAPYATPMPGAPGGPNAPPPSGGLPTPGVTPDQ